MTSQMELKTKIALELAIENLKTFILADYNRDGFNLRNKNDFRVEPGRRYTRLLFENSTWCFIVNVTSDIYKAATWRAPAKHVRGNIYDTKTWNGFSWTGPQYLR